MKPCPPKVALREINRQGGILYTKDGKLMARLPEHLKNESWTKLITLIKDQLLEIV